MNEMISKYELDPKLKLGLLNQVEEHLDTDIEELTGCDKIEILFMIFLLYISLSNDIIFFYVCKKTIFRLQAEFFHVYITPLKSDINN